MALRIAVVGAGLIGSRHITAIQAANGVELSSITDPSENATQIAKTNRVLHFNSLAGMIETDRPDGIIIATPNQMHLENALACINAGIPTLIEKPLASTLEEARKIMEAGDAANVPLLTGHHRRHNPLVAKAKALIDDGEIGKITAVHGSAWFYKPDDYFETEWRRKKGAGPVYINLIHDIDMLRHLCGDIHSVHAMESSATRKNEVEDTAAILLNFKSGALGTVTVSDATVAPYSWELTARENPAYPATTQDCYRIGGTHGTLALPNLTVWSNPAKRSWWEPINATKHPFDFVDPLVAQIDQFASVIRGEEAPLVSAKEGYENQRIIEAVKQSAATGMTIDIE